MSKFINSVAFVGILLVPAFSHGDQEAGSAAKPPVVVKKIGPISPPSAETVRTRVLEWTAQLGLTDAAKLAEIAKLWVWPDAAPSAEELFESAVASFAIADESTKRLIEQCDLRRSSLVPPEASELERESAGSFYGANLSLFFGRYLARRQMYEESLEVLQKISPVDVIDPASLLFFKAVCQHHLLMKVEGLETIEQLLRYTEGVPLRYSTVGTLMQYDLESLKEQSLDEVARKMTDVERRLDLGRTGQGVQKKEDEIITALDELIKKAEENQGGGGGAGGQSNRSASPANDSVIKGSTAPGNVDPKKFKNNGEWGDLPPKSRAKAKDQISREFPAHYRDAIDEYTKKAAKRQAGSGK